MSLFKDREVLAFARMTRYFGGNEEIPAFAGIEMFNPIINDVCFYSLYVLIYFLGFVLRMKEYFVYMLTSKYHNVVYIGITNTS